MLVLVLLTFLVTSTGADQRPTPDAFRIVPGVRVGAITPTSSEADLRTSYPGRVVSADVDVGEGQTEPGTVLFADDPERKLEITWKDPVNKRNPKSIQIGGKKSVWKTAEGISLGSSLQEIERINGGPFTLAGFGWDYSGTVTSWKNGRLAAPFSKNGRILLRLTPERENALSRRELNAVSGDSDHSSREPAMQKLNPRVYQIIVLFNLR